MPFVFLIWLWGLLSKPVVSFSVTVTPRELSGAPADIQTFYQQLASERCRNYMMPKGKVVGFADCYVEFDNCPDCRQTMVGISGIAQDPATDQAPKAQLQQCIDAWRSKYPALAFADMAAGTCQYGHFAAASVRETDICICWDDLTSSQKKEFSRDWPPRVFGEVDRIKKAFPLWARMSRVDKIQALIDLAKPGSHAQMLSDMHSDKDYLSVVCAAKAKLVDMSKAELENYVRSYIRRQDDPPQIGQADLTARVANVNIALQALGATQSLDAAVLWQNLQQQLYQANAIHIQDCWYSVPEPCQNWKNNDSAATLAQMDVLQDLCDLRQVNLPYLNNFFAQCAEENVSMGLMQQLWDDTNIDWHHVTDIKVNWYCARRVGTEAEHYKICGVCGPGYVARNKGWITALWKKKIGLPAIGQS